MYAFIGTKVQSWME